MVCQKDLRWGGHLDVGVVQKEPLLGLGAESEREIVQPVVTHLKQRSTAS